MPTRALANQFGAYHGIEVPYVFGNLDPALGYDAEDRALSVRMMRYWASFARTGRPDSPDDEVWPRFDQEPGGFLNIEKE